MYRFLIAVALPVGALLGFLGRSPVRPPIEPGPNRVCVEPGAGYSPDCSQVELATRWCEARLSTLDSPARLSMGPRTVPDDFAQQVNDALVACGVPAEAEVVDCSEIPCVIAAHVADPVAVEAAFEDCPRLRALGFDPAPIQRWPVQCPDGTVSSMALIIAGSELDALSDAVVPADIRDAEDLGSAIMAGLYVAGQMGRRADQLARRWPCGPG